jgi:hypothetical protein
MHLIKLFKSFFFARVRFFSVNGTSCFKNTLFLLFICVVEEGLTVGGEIVTESYLFRDAIFVLFLMVFSLKESVAGDGAA